MPTPKNYIRDKRSPTPLNSNVSRVMRSNKRAATKPELKLRKWLFENGYKGYRLNYKKIPGTPDICFVKDKIAFFVHGCFWHRCPSCSDRLPKHNSGFWKQKFEKNVLRDANKMEALRKLNWQPFVIWECEISPIFKPETEAKIHAILRKNINNEKKGTKE